MPANIIFLRQGSNNAAGTHTLTIRVTESTMKAIPVSELTSLIGKDMGHSDWLQIDQERVNQFAECTGDHQFIHIDEEKAKQTPFGGTIAHGFLSLSLLPALSAGLMPRPEGLKMAVNYGMDSLRFIQPVRVGSRVRLHTTILDVTEKNPGQWLMKARNTLEIEGVDKPACLGASRDHLILRRVILRNVDAPSQCDLAFIGIGTHFLKGFSKDSGAFKDCVRR